MKRSEEIKQLIRLREQQKKILLDAAHKQAREISDIIFFLNRELALISNGRKCDEDIAL